APAETRPRQHQHRLHALAQARARAVAARHPRVDRAGRGTGAEPRRRFRRRAADAGELRAGGAGGRPARAHLAARRRRGDDPAARRRAPGEHPPAAAAWRRGSGEPGRLPSPGRDPRGLSGGAVRRGGDGVGQGVGGALPHGRARARARHAGYRRLRLVPLRMAVRGGRLGDAGARRGGDAGLLRADPARVQPERGGRAADHRRLFAERHHRHLRPHPREPAALPPDGDRAVAQPVAQRNAVANHRHQPVDDAGALRAAADRAGHHLRAHRCHPARHLRRHLFVHLHLRADPGRAGRVVRQLRAQDAAGRRAGRAGGRRRRRFGRAGL
ncbi:MAG: Protein translocase subunit SecF, partial [uncultured Sphingomonadaceae bacterium]